MISTRYSSCFMNCKSVPINLAAGGHNNIAGLRTVWGTGRGTRPGQVSHGRPSLATLGQV